MDKKHNLVILPNSWTRNARKPIKSSKNSDFVLYL